MGESYTCFHTLDCTSSVHGYTNRLSRFGWGRRICPGADLASNSLFVALAKLLWAFGIEPKDGVEYDTFNYT